MVGNVKNLLADEKSKLVEYIKKCYKMKKTSFYNYKKLLS